MGIGVSKSPLERRNTVARRSQRRTIHNIKSKVDRVAQDIKKFKGIEEDVNYESLMSELDHLKVELLRKSKDLQPQVTNIYQVTLSKIEESVQTLNNKLLENQDKFRKKGNSEQDKARQKHEKNKEKEPDDTENIQNDNDIIITEEENEAHEIAASTERRKTLEVKFVKIVPPDEDVQPPENQGVTSKMVSPEDKRKSILKVGVPVMPGAMMNEISSKSKKISSHYNHTESTERSDEDILLRVNEMISNLQAIECQIADFVGRKNGTQYHRIRDQLNEYLIELNRINIVDEYINEQVKLCKNYVGSNMNFLDEKAINDKRYDSNDDVFQSEDNKVPLSPIEVETKLQKLTKTTAI